MSYESPIHIIDNSFDAISDAIAQAEAISKSIDDMVVQACIKVGCHVDRDELVKALEYDRGQYEKGFHDGRLGYERVVHCEDCKYGEYREGHDDYECHSSGCGLVHKGNWYCADGEPKDTREEKSKLIERYYEACLDGRKREEET